MTGTSRRRTLAIDSATEACSVALFDGDELVAATFRVLGRGHAEALVPMIADLPERGRADRILVGLGPGSFTGLRIGLAAARALGLAWNCPVLGFPSLALVALAAREQAGADPVPILVATTAGHGEWFCQAFDAAGLPSSSLVPLLPEAAAGCAGDIVAGSQAEALVARRGGGTPILCWPDVRAAIRLPEALLTADLAPIYGRAPDARLPGATRG
jgi:tRNA threonylcarbamoyl adenosine modification protein YeaZ